MNNVPAFMNTKYVVCQLLSRQGALHWKYSGYEPSGRADFFRTN